MSGPASTRGLTLLEIVAVLGILSILIVLLVPAVSKIQDNTRKTRAAIHLREIAQAYATYATQDGRIRSVQADSIYDWALVLAQHAGLNDATVYYVTDDPQVAQTSGTLPRIVARPPQGESAAWTLDPAFDGFPLSITVVAGIHPQAPPETTPIAWTRGLDGTASRWNAFDAAVPGVYGSSGGHIAFMDGRVEFFEDLTGQLVHATTRAPADNVLDALPAGARILRASLGTAEAPDEGS